MNYTANHHLPQWSESDRVRMDDFNSAMAAIDSGLSENASAASAAQSSAAIARSTALAAQNNALAAKTTAAAAQEKADAAYSPDDPPYVCGTYVGTGATLNIELGFSPKFVIVSGMKPSTSETSFESFIKYFAVSSKGNLNNLSTRVQPFGLGFAVYRAGNYGNILPDLSEEGRTYEYIAFR